MFNRVLVLSPHTDDGELGCGGSLAKFISEGKEIHYVAFSSCKRSVPPGMDKDILKIEVKNATKVLGIKPENLRLLEFDVRTFPSHRQEILEKIIQLRDNINPDLVLVPSSSDVHQDHNTIRNEAIRAFKKCAIILGYEHPWNNLNFNNDLFINLLEKHVDSKISALNEYKSQAQKKYFQKDFIKAWARTRGGQIDGNFAETFEIIRWIIK